MVHQMIHKTISTSFLIPHMEVTNFSPENDAQMDPVHWMNNVESTDDKR